MTMPEFTFDCIDDGLQLVHRPQHYECPFKLNKITCDTFVSLMPFYLGCAFKYIWRAGRKPGEPLLRDLGKASESIELWWDVRDGWTEHGTKLYPNELTLRYLFEILINSDCDEENRWRLSLLESIVHNADPQYIINCIDDEIRRFKGTV